MNEKQICTRLRREFGKSGVALIVYYWIMNAAVMVTAFVDALLYALQSADMVDLNVMIDRLLSNGWGYIAACLIGFSALLIWKKSKFCFHDIWKADKPMPFGNFLAILCIFLGAQAFFEVFAGLLEWFLNLFDMSVMESIEAATISADTLSMFLYMGLFAPVFEEILFRGLILRSLQPYGKKFAIFASAFLFGVFHGNIVQSPFAFVVGLVLGYVAVEYSMLWAVVLHMINNLILGDSMYRLFSLLPGWAGELGYFLIIWGSAVAAIVILILKRKQIASYFRTGKIHPLCLKSFFTSPALVIFNVLMILNILVTLVLPILT